MDIRFAAGNTILYSGGNEQFTDQVNYQVKVNKDQNEGLQKKFLVQVITDILR